MKKATIAVIITLFAGGVVFYARESHRHAERESIIAALKVRREERKQSVAWVQKGFRRKTMLMPREFLRRLKEIGTDGCPDAFRLSWLKYIQAWERFAEPGPIAQRQDRLTMAAVKGKIEGNASLTSLGGGLTVEADLSNFEDMARRLEPRDTDEAFRHVENTALRFGVDALKWE